MCVCHVYFNKLTYKIVSGEYDKDITPTLMVSNIRIGIGVMICDFKSHVLNMTHVNFILPTRSLIIGIACQIGL